LLDLKQEESWELTHGLELDGVEMKKGTTTEAAEVLFS